MPTDASNYPISAHNKSLRDSTILREEISSILQAFRLIWLQGRSMQTLVFLLWNGYDAARCRQISFIHFCCLHTDWQWGHLRWRAASSASKAASLFVCCFNFLACSFFSLSVGECCRQRLFGDLAWSLGFIAEDFSICKVSTSIL